MTLEELATKHEDGYNGDYSFTKDQLRALITEVVGIVAGEPVAYGHTTFGDVDDVCLIDDNGYKTPLYAIDMRKLK